MDDKTYENLMISVNKNESKIIYQADIAVS